MRERRLKGPPFSLLFHLLRRGLSSDTFHPSNFYFIFFLFLLLASPDFRGLLLATSMAAIKSSPDGAAAGHDLLPTSKLQIIIKGASEKMLLLLTGPFLFLGKRLQRDGDSGHSLPSDGDFNSTKTAAPPAKGVEETRIAVFGIHFWRRFLSSS